MSLGILNSWLPSRLRSPGTGPIPFVRFMELALYHPQYGYYMRQPEVRHQERIGWSGDFYTSSDVHPILGQRDCRDRPGNWTTLLGTSRPLHGRGDGAGKGLLARDFLRHAMPSQDDFASRLRYMLIERSPAMQALQRQQSGALG